MYRRANTVRRGSRAKTSPVVGTRCARWECSTGRRHDGRRQEANAFPGRCAQAKDEPSQEGIAARAVRHRRRAEKADHGKAAIPKPVTILRAPTEWKTGVKHAEVVTARLAQDERGWLRLAG